MSNKNNNKKILITTFTLIVVTLMMAAFSGVFANASINVKDIEGHWAKNVISAWVKEGLTSGYPDGSFKPDNHITRAEFATLVNRSFHFSEAGDAFLDVSESDWFFKEIAKAKRAGYMAGYENGTVRPTASITRQEVATIIAKLKILNEDKKEAEKFSDYERIPNWSKGLIGAVVSKKYMKGYPNGNFEPEKSITRAESVAALNNIVGLNVSGGKNASITVNVSEFLKVIKEIKVNSSALGSSFKIDGFETVKNFGEGIAVHSESEKSEFTVFILDENGNTLGKILIDASKSETKSYDIQ